MSMSSSFRAFGLTLALIAFLVPWNQAQTQGAKKPVLTVEQQEKLKERNRLLSEALKLQRMNKLAEAIPLMEKVLALQQIVFGPVHAEIPSLLNWLALAHERRQNFPAAQKAREDIVKICKQLHGEKHWKVVDARLELAHVVLLAKLTPKIRARLADAQRFSNQGDSLLGQGKFADAAKVFPRALEIWKQILGEDHRFVATNYHDLAAALWRQGKTAAAQQLNLKALDIRRKVLGEEHPETAYSYIFVATTLYVQHKYAAAEEHERKALAIRRKVFGEDHADTAVVYRRLASLLFVQGKYGAAEAIHRALLARNRKILGEEHADTAESYSSLANILVKLAEYAKAEQLHRKALAIRRKVLGENHPKTADSYGNLGVVLSDQAKYSAAAELHRKALAIHRKALGDNHPNTASSYNNLALVLWNQAKYATAEELHRKALAIRRKALGENHPDTATSYNNLAVVLDAQGTFATAEKLHRTALAIRRKALGENHPDTASSYNNLAVVLDTQGTYAAAEDLHRKALAIRLKLLGENHPDTANSYNNLAISLMHQGKYKEAAQLHLKAVAIRPKHLGVKHPDTARSLSSLALLLENQGMYVEAERLHRGALAILLECLGANHPGTATSYHNLAIALKAQRRYKSAEVFHRNALTIRLKVLGENHPDTASSYNKLGVVLMHRGKYAEAEDWQRKALAIRLKFVGMQHPDTATSYNNLAPLLIHQGKYVAAEELYRKALDISLNAVGEDDPESLTGHANLAYALYLQGKHAGAEQQLLRAGKSYHAARLRMSFTGLGRAQFGAAYSPGPFLAALLARNGKPAAAWKAFEEDLGRGLFDDLSARHSRAQKLTRKEIHHEKTIQVQLSQIDMRLRALLAVVKKNSKDVAALRMQSDKLQKDEKRLLLELIQFQAQMEKKYGPAAGKVYDLKMIQAQLGANAALVGWVDLWAPAKAKNPNGEHWGVVVRRKGPPVWVKLAGALDGKWTAKDALLLRNARKILLDPGTEPDKELSSLYRQRLRPLEKHFQGIKHLIVLPSSAMAGIPIEALTDRYRVSYAPSGTIYAWLQEKRKGFVPGKSGLLALGDPAFSAEQAKVVLAKKDDALGRLLRGDKLKPLPGTRSEVEAIGQLFAGQKQAVLTFLGTDATGANLDLFAQKKKLAGFRYLHLATHGFADPRGGMNSYLALTPEDFTLSSHAKLSAGHIMGTWQLNADLVTLSACQTALGEHQGGEGYVGFSQALFFAGARTLVLSQWQVNDWSTTLLMKRLYQNLLGARRGLKAGMAKGEALWEAKSWLRKLNRAEVKAGLKAVGILTRLKSAGTKDPDKYVDGQLQGEQPFGHPHYWAAFILIGDAGIEEEKEK